MGKYPEGLDVAVDYNFYDAVFQRRSRRFGLGMEIDRGPLTYKSKHEPVSLSEVEEAILVWTGLGIKGINLSDFPPHVGLDLEMQFTSKTIPALGDVHRTELFYTNDEGTYMIKMHDKRPDDFKGLEGLTRDKRIDRIVELFRESKIKIHDGRADLPSKPPGIAAHNLWNVNKPGTSVFMPVTDLSACIINLLFFYMRPDHRFNFVDELHGMRPPGTKGWLEKGFLDESKRMPLIEAELRFANGYIAEQAFMGQNMVLALQTLGLGGWLFSGFASMFMLGGTPFNRGLGFRFITPDIKGDTGNPNPVAVGKDDMFHAFCPPYYKDMGEAVEALNDLKWTNWETHKMPYKDPEGVLGEIERPSKEEIQVVKDICNYIYDTYGRFPAFSDPMFLRFMVQAHHLDLDFYDKYYPEGAYTENCKHHFGRWHPEIDDPFANK
ncbi:MAG TPA: hypothetical protein VLB82_04290 [Thermodesulfobacteriota bacterium]|nr:hypothetical protein [Thermodesulfobacteriota bacterium]